ncbi:FixH family protein [Bacillus sp. JJ1562]|uniref:FixH family protein n=1 Tax=Bacillus sp. JJ1562 TaxID=3122960 RepID=UPI003002EFE2
MRKISFIFLTSLFIIIMGCNTTGNQKNDSNQIVPISVNLKTTTEMIIPGEEIVISAVVTQEDEAVEDADEVKFEIWEEGNEEHEMIEAFHSGGGKYSIEKNFTKDGIYHVIAHVTARGMHSMPAVVLIVGDIENTEVDENQENNH